MSDEKRDPKDDFRPDTDHPIFQGPYVGYTVEWEKSGRARGEIARGEVIAEVPEGMTNKEAFDLVTRHRPYEWKPYLKSYRKFSGETHTTERVIIAVENNDNSRAQESYYFYAPNRWEVVPV